MDLTISWLDDGRAQWALATDAVDALRRWRWLRASGARKIEVKNDDGDALSRKDLERLAAVLGGRPTVRSGE